MKTLKKNKPAIEKKIDHYIIHLNKSLYSENKIKQNIKNVPKIGFVSSSNKDYFVLKIHASDKDKCLELLNYLFFLQR